MVLTVPASLTEWLARAVEHYRSRAAADPALLPHVSRYRNFAAPCQILGFTVADPPWQGFVVTHLPGLEDKRIVVQEGIVRWTMNDALAKAFVDPVWDQPMPEPMKSHGGYLSLREVGFRALDQLANSQRSSLYVDGSRMEHFVQTGYVTSFCSEYNHFGILSAVSPEDWIEEAFREAQQQLERQEADPPQLGPWPLQKERPFAAYGAFAPEGLRIGQITSKKLNDWYWADRDFPGIIVYTGTIGPFPIKATQNGFLSIEAPTKQAANSWVNCIMAAFLTKGLPAAVVREQDMASVHLPTGNDHVWGGSFPGADQRRQGWIFNRSRISNDELGEILRIAENHAKQRYARHLASFLEAHTHFQGHEWTQSFIFSWSIIEQELTERWKHFLQPTGISNKRRQKLEGTGWTLDDRCEVLQIAGGISQATYDQLAEVRKARNRIVHGGQLATDIDAKQALALAEALMTEGVSPVRGEIQKSQWELEMGEFL